MKQLMLGNEAVARGLYEAGCSFVSSYPGTPSTEITETSAKHYGKKYKQHATFNNHIHRAKVLSC